MLALPAGRTLQGTRKARVAGGWGRCSDRGSLARLAPYRAPRLGYGMVTAWCVLVRGFKCEAVVECDTCGSDNHVRCGRLLLDQERPQEAHVEDRPLATCSILSALQRTSCARTFCSHVDWNHSCSRRQDGRPRCTVLTVNAAIIAADAVMIAYIAAREWWRSRG